MGVAASRLTNQMRAGTTRASLFRAGPFRLRTPPIIGGNRNQNDRSGHAKPNVARLTSKFGGKRAKFEWVLLAKLGRPVARSIQVRVTHAYLDALRRFAATVG